MITCKQCNEEVEDKYVFMGICVDCIAQNEGDRRFELEAHGED